MKTGVVTYPASTTRWTHYDGSIATRYDPEKRMKVFVHGRCQVQPSFTAIIVEDMNGGVHVVNEKILKYD